MVLTKESEIKDLTEDQKFYILFSLCPHCLDELITAEWITDNNGGVMANCLSCEIIFVGGEEYLDGYNEEKK